MPTVCMTPDQEPLVRQLHLEGHSAAQIGSAIGKPDEPQTYQANRGRGRRALARLGLKPLLRQGQNGVREAEYPEPPPAEPVKLGRRFEPPSSSETAELGSSAKRVVESTESTAGESREIHAKVRGKIKTLEELIEVCEIDTEQWEIERWMCGAWMMGYKNANKEADSLQLFRVSATLKRKSAQINVRAAMQELIEELKRHAPIGIFAPSKFLRPTDGLLFELSMPDLHVGKLAWGLETSSEYSLELAERVFKLAFENLVGRVDGSSISRVLFPVGNDLLNCDNLAGTTTGGTPQSNDGSYQRAFLTATRLMIWAVEQLRQIAPVDVICVPGNHDTFQAGRSCRILELGSATPRG